QLSYLFRMYPLYPSPPRGAIFPLHASPRGRPDPAARRRRPRQTASLRAREHPRALAVRRVGGGPARDPPRRAGHSCLVALHPGLRRRVRRHQLRDAPPGTGRRLPRLARSVTRLQAARSTLAQVERGDLTVKVQDEEADELGYLGASVNRTTGAIAGLVRQVQHQSQDLAAMAQQLAASAQELQAAS